MDFSFEAISAAEHDRLQALYAPLTQAVRRLIEAGIRTGADEATIREAQTAIEAVAEKLGGHGRTRACRALPWTGARWCGGTR